ncbi:MAG: hypothetical protein ABSG50_05570 [Opitutaceae bacterium]|jgi:hypothetical protein
MAHSQSCKECKAAIRGFLVDVFGQDEVVEQYCLPLPSELRGYEGHRFYSALMAIESDLKAYRGFVCFVRRPKLPPVDFFLKSVGLVVEFDEAQHFTKPRAIALKRYPETLGLGFSREQWIRLSVTLDRHDNSPPYRDEQRAWYDTLRDFAPACLNLQPIVRLYAGDAKWCKLDRGELVRALLFHAPPLTEYLTTAGASLTQRSKPRP